MIRTAIGIAGFVLALIIWLQPRLREPTERNQLDLPSRIRGALSERANREIRREDYNIPTTRYFTPHDVISAVDFIEAEMDLQIPRSVYWQETIGEVIAALTAFVENNSTTPSAANSTTW